MRLGCDQGLRYRCPGMSPGLVLVGTECHGMPGDTQLGKRLHPHGKFTPQPSGTWKMLPEVQVAPLPRRAVPPQALCSTSPRLVSLLTVPGGFMLLVVCSGNRHGLFLWLLCRYLCSYHPCICCGPLQHRVL